MNIFKPYTNQFTKGIVSRWNIMSRGRDSLKGSSQVNSMSPRITHCLVIRWRWCRAKQGGIYTQLLVSIHDRWREIRNGLMRISDIFSRITLTVLVHKLSPIASSSGPPSNPTSRQLRISPALVLMGITATFAKYFWISSLTGGLPVRNILVAGDPRTISQRDSRSSGKRFGNNSSPALIQVKARGS